MKATKRVALTIDGSEDGCRDPISNVMAILPDCSALLLKQIAHTTEVHSTENILREINTCTAELAAIGVSVRGVTSDNEPKMVEVRNRYHDIHNTPTNIIVTPGIALTNEITF